MFVIPMAGLSSRFSEKGYKKFKYELPLKLDGLKGDYVFDFCLNSFSNYFASDLFVFITREIKQKKFIVSRINKLRIKNYKIINLQKVTRGQAETVYIGLKKILLDENIYIFNIDTILLNFNKKINNIYDGLIETFIGKGDQWSFVSINKKNLVIKTAEKKRISKYCSNGLYYFKNKEIYNSAFKEYKKSFPRNKELYIAPIYNKLIKNNYIIKNKLIPKKNIIFVGTPEEYESVKAN